MDMVRHAGQAEGVYRLFMDMSFKEEADVEQYTRKVLVMRQDLRVYKGDMAQWPWREKSFGDENIEARIRPKGW